MTEIRYITSNYSSIVFKSFKIGSIRFWVVRFQVGLGFGSSDLGSSRISGHSGLGQVKFWIAWSHIVSNLTFGSLVQSGRVSRSMILGCLKFQILSGRVESDLGQFDFLKKSNQVGSDLNRLDEFFEWIKFCHLYVPKYSYLSSYVFIVQIIKYL
jgi:hypothetical protein